jgi:rhodanese-related sulfurtransferase
MPLSPEQEISVSELQRRLGEPDPPQVLDVRELSEVRFCSLGGIHIPLGILPLRLGELDRGKEYVVLCHHGNRSYHATMFLLKSGFTRARNVRGGIDAWSATVDPAVPRY